MAAPAILKRQVVYGVGGPLLVARVTIFLCSSTAEGSSAREKVEDVMRKVTSVCDAVMPRRKMGIHTSQSTDGVIESHNSVRSAQDEEGISEPEGNPPFLN